MSTSMPSRRQFLRLAVASAALPLVFRSIGAAHGGELKPLPPDNAQAKALGYVEDAETTKNAARKPESICANCQFFSATNSACALFSGFSVAPKGWCSAWAKQAA